MLVNILGLVILLLSTPKLVISMELVSVLRLVSFSCSCGCRSVVGGFVNVEASMDKDDSSAMTFTRTTLGPKHQISIADQPFHQPCLPQEIMILHIEM